MDRFLGCASVRRDGRGEGWDDGGGQGELGDVAGEEGGGEEEGAGEGAGEGGESGAGGARDVEGEETARVRGVRRERNGSRGQGRGVQIVSLGAGSDTRFWRLMVCRNHCLFSEARGGDKLTR